MCSVISVPSKVRIQQYPLRQTKEKPQNPSRQNSPQHRRILTGYLPNITLLSEAAKLYHLPAEFIRNCNMHVCLNLYITWPLYMSQESCVRAPKVGSCDQQKTLTVRMDVQQVMTSSWVSRKVALITGYSITATFQGSKPEVSLTLESCFVFFIGTHSALQSHSALHTTHMPL